MQTIEDLGARILDVVVSNFDYFRERPPHLAWAMMNYELIHRVGPNSPNPKYAIEERMGKLSKENGNLLYDAWAVTVSYGEFPDTNPHLPLESKRNKTMDEWIALYTTPAYRFNSLFPNEFAVKNHLLCIGGTGHNWNNDGFLTKIGPSGVDNIIFAGYTRSEDSVDDVIKNKILEVRLNPIIRTKAEAYLSESSKIAQKIYSGESWSDAMRPDLKEIREKRKRMDREMQQKLAELPEKLRLELKIDELIDEIFAEKPLPSPEERKEYSGLSPYSNLVRMPVHAHQSYVIAGIGVARDIVATPEGHSESKRFAREFLELRAT